MRINKRIYNYFKEREVETVILVIVLSVACIVVTLLGLWAIDISVSAMKVNSDHGNVAGGYILTNGFRDTDPMQMYHLGMWAVIITNFILVVIISHITIAYLKKKLEIKKNGG